MTYFKLTNAKETHYGMKYHDGLNEDILEWNPNADCAPGGIYFSDEKNILAFLNHDSKFIREITLPKDAMVSEGKNKFKANKVILGKRHDLTKLSTWKWMISKGIDIHANNDEALRWASCNGHLDVVKYLVEHGADIHANNDEALRWASCYGHLEVVKYLVEKGANINAEDDYALRLASHNGHLEVVEYLENIKGI